ncbi:MAG: hypothetical protein KDA28_01940, partial [Phycisphaerales bacterium]|nr:hypothetical protein [Phycisphaerales bacterium]
GSRVSDPLRPANQIQGRASSAGSFDDAGVRDRSPRISDPLRPANQIQGNASSIGGVQNEGENERRYRIVDPFDESLLVDRGGVGSFDDAGARRHQTDIDHQWARSVPVQWRVIDARRRGLVIEGIGAQDGAIHAFRMVLTDLNGDGASDAFDTLIFIRAFELGADEADLNGDGSVDIFDLLEFLEANG